MRILGGMLLGVGLWVVLGRGLDILINWANRKLDEKPHPSEPEGEREWRSRHEWLSKRADLLDEAANDVERITKRLLPWGWAATVLGAFLVLVDPG